LPASNPTPAIWIYFERFHAGEIPLEEFEQWLYGSAELETALGRDDYLALITVNYHAPDARAECVSESRKCTRHTGPASSSAIVRADWQKEYWTAKWT